MAEGHRRVYLLTCGGQEAERKTGMGQGQVCFYGMPPVICLLKLGSTFYFPPPPNKGVL
jgi:hypothetical protein